MSAGFKGTAIAVCALALAACDSDNDIFVPVQVIHAVANAPAVDVTNGAATLYTGVEFKQATGFNPVFYGETALSVNANLPDGSQATVIGPANVPLQPGNEYSIVAVGSVGSMATPVQPIVVSNAVTPVTAGNVRVQVVHGAAGAPPVDIHVTGPADPVVPANAIAGGSTPFGAFSDQLEVPAGDYRIRVTLPGDSDPVFDSGTVALPAGADLVVVAIDNTVAGRSDGDASPITLLVADGTSSFEILDAATPADLRVVHAVPDLNGVDVYVNDPMAMGTPAIPDLDFPEVFPAVTPGAPDNYLELPAGTYSVLVTVAGNAGIIGIPATDVALEAGAQYTVYASNTLAAGIEPFITVDDSRSIATEARVRLIHLAPSADLVDIYVTAPGTSIAGLMPTFAGVDFQEETGYVSLVPGDYEVTVTVAGTKTAAIGPASISIDAGGVYTAVARDPDADIANDPFGLILLDDF